MIRKEDWQDAKKTEIPRGARLVALISSPHTEDGFYMSVIHTSKCSDTFTTFPNYAPSEHSNSEILWWQSAEMPFGMEDDKLSWEYVVRFAPSIAGYSHERYEVDKDDTTHAPTVYGCMWRVSSQKDPNRSVDIYVRTTNDPKYSKVLFVYERYRKMNVFNGIWRKVLVDRWLMPSDGEGGMGSHITEFLDDPLQ